MFASCLIVLLVLRFVVWSLDFGLGSIFGLSAYAFLVFCVVGLYGLHCC